jgi:hypothetical protein
MHDQTKINTAIDPRSRATSRRMFDCVSDGMDLPFGHLGNLDISMRKQKALCCRRGNGRESFDTLTEISLKDLYPSERA